MKTFIKATLVLSIALSTSTAKSRGGGDKIVKNFDRKMKLFKKLKRRVSKYKRVIEAKKR
ncbi:MAG: hypothetical protein GXO06_04270 [Epsilonproteobacteria bacterium]|nr:hypothetical protein [Campylobacterota bacterium]